MSAATAQPMTAASPLGLRLTDLARHAAGLASGRPYRDASTGAWCSPTTPHVLGCICPPGVIGCDADWRAWQHAVAASGTGS